MGGLLTSRIQIAKGLSKDTGGKDDHSSSKERGDLLPTEKEKLTNESSVDQMGPKVVEPSENVRIESDKTTILSKDSTS